MNTLTKAQKTILRKSSRGGVALSFARLQRYVLQSRWLGKNNRYAVDTIKKLKKDLRAGQHIKSDHLAEYIAASAPLHCCDGWSYLGRSLICHARGDFSTALHLAYYAELRAAISLLATEGLGIFSQQHFVVDQNSQCLHIPTKFGTHVITWMALEHWTDLKRSSALITRVIKPGSRTLSEWFDDFAGNKTTGSLVTRRMLKHWGLDLKQVTEDRNARNEVSYRPDRLVPKASLNANEVSEFLQNFWQSLEPSPSSSFEVLDRHLLRLTLEEVYAATTGKEASEDQVGFGIAVDRLLDRISPIGLSQNEWRQFLTRVTAPNTPELLTHAASKGKVGGLKHHMQVMSRATLLLRVATGACHQLIDAVPFGGPELQFWWSKVGTDIGMWDAVQTPGQLADLWADVEAAIEELQVWENADLANKREISDWWLRLSGPISVLGTTERVALWGLGI